MPNKRRKNFVGNTEKPKRWANPCRKQGAYDRRSGRHEDHGHARTALEERNPPGADDVDHQGLGSDGLDEPSGAELHVAGVKQREHDVEGDEVED